MMKRAQAFTDSGDSSDGKGSGSDGSDLDKEMLSLAKKNKNKAAPAPAPKKPKQAAYSDSDSSDSDLDWGSKSKGKKARRKKKSASSKKSSIRRSISTPSSSDDDEDDQRSEVTRNSSIMPESMQSQSIKKDEDLEEGEVDDSGDSSDSSEFNDGYDDQLMGDEEDRRRLNAMTEKEREQEIYKRVEQREIMKTRFDIEKKLRQANKRANKKQKKAEAASVVSKFGKTDAKERSKERKKTVEAKVDKKTQAMDLLKAKREAKKERAEEKEKQRMEEMSRRDDDYDLATEKDDLDTKSTITERSGPRRKLKTEDIYSDDSASDWENSSTVNAKTRRDSSSDDSDSETGERSPKHTTQYVDNVADLNRIRLTRTKIEKWVHCPFFSRIAKGCFVRIGIGFNVEKPVYQVAEVMEVVETGKVYNLGNTRTNKGVRLRHASFEKVFRLEYVSQSDFQENEFKRWKENCETRSVMRPTMEEIRRKEEEITEAANYQFKEEDIEHIITEKQKFKQCPVNFAVKKTQLMKEKENAMQIGDEKRSEELSRQIADLDDRAKELDKERSKSISSIGYINQRNRKKNVEQAEKAIMEEVRANKGKKVEDPFTRRNTKPMIVHRPIGFQDALDGSQNAIAGMSQEVKTEEPSPPAEPEEKEEASNDNADETKKILDDLSLDDDEFTLDLLKTDIQADKKLTVNDLFQAHDFDIKLELDEKVVLPNLPIVARAIIPPQVRDVGPRRSLNLEDYKRKRGLI